MGLAPWVLVLQRWARYRGRRLHALLASVDAAGTWVRSGSAYGRWWDAGQSFFSRLAGRISSRGTAGRLWRPRRPPPALRAAWSVVAVFLRHGLGYVKYVEVHGPARRRLRGVGGRLRRRDLVHGAERDADAPFADCPDAGAPAAGRPRLITWGENHGKQGSFEARTGWWW